MCNFGNFIRNSGHIIHSMHVGFSCKLLLLFITNSNARVVITCLRSVDIDIAISNTWQYHGLLTLSLSMPLRHLYKSNADNRVWDYMGHGLCEEDAFSWFTSETTDIWLSIHDHHVYGSFKFPKEEVNRAWKWPAKPQFVLKWMSIIIIIIIFFFFFFIKKKKFYFNSLLYNIWFGLISSKLLVSKQQWTDASVLSHIRGIIGNDDREYFTQAHLQRNIFVPWTYTAWETTLFALIHNIFSAR